MSEEKNNRVGYNGGDDPQNGRSTNDQFLIARWIAASLAGELTEEEAKLLDEWRVKSGKNVRLYDRILDEENRKLKKEQFACFNKRTGWEGYLKKRAREARVPLSLRHIIRYAVILLIPLGFAFYFLMTLQPKVELPLSKACEIIPGGARAELTLANGKKIDLVRESGIITHGGGTVIQNMENLLLYRDSTEVETTDSLIYNEVTVPTGGEYQLRLSDGTFVFLNSMTKIRFPVRFSGDCREVELEGEAYFEVTKNKEKSFVVKTAAYDVTVLGTQFNVTAYADEKITSTTLVEGAVVVSGKGMPEARPLRPNERFVLNKLTGETGVELVDVSSFTAWKDGKFRFRDVRLEEIMRMVERWYDVTVVYEDEDVKDFRFGFNVSRHETIDPLLRVFELNGKVKICREGKMLKVKRGR